MRVINKAIRFALGVNMGGEKELLGFWMSDNEGAKFSLNSVIRSTSKRRKLFPSDDSALKVGYLAISQAEKKWTMPIQNWRMALNRFMIEFGNRIQKYDH